MAKVFPMTVHLPDTRGVSISRYGAGNAKLGFGVFTYSRPAGNRGLLSNVGGTCPGSTDECEAVCYAKRIGGPVLDVYRRNEGDDVPEIPRECVFLRLHVSGDFNTVEYINNWVARLQPRPEVTAWAYTRSWRVPELLPALERLRALSNVQLFASMDSSCADVPPAHWRRAWIQRDGQNEFGFGPEPRLEPLHTTQTSRGIITTHWKTPGDGRGYTCPEETGHKKDCLDCGYCFEGRHNDVVFLEHTGRKHTTE